MDFRLPERLETRHQNSSRQRSVLLHRTDALAAALPRGADDPSEDARQACIDALAGLYPLDEDAWPSESLNAKDHRLTRELPV
ncbi:hypothetical protein WME79_45455 [Sorangium sp. So ce726]|uniref:hypothetical protein n=1 Tax=Sorangium sp. So ce726 TaxID=3133319 RepID=UPI003F62DEC7